MKRKTTKELLAETPMERAEAKRIDKIAIINIAENCSMTKPAFYSCFKRGVCFLLVLLLVCSPFMLSACGADPSSASVPAAVPSLPALPSPKGLRIAAASDLHLNPDKRPDSNEPSASSYSSELVDALLWDVQQQNADILLLTGDLCNGGKAQHHAALTEKLKRAEASGLTIFVLPGNHDLAPVTQTEFAQLYADFGYAEAFSRDPSSLSYCVIQNDLMILMMDTAGYSVGAIDLPGDKEADPENPFFTETTLQWVERMLKSAAERNLHILAAGHHNLLSAFSRDPNSSGYYLLRGERFFALLREYRATLYLSGHAHSRSVYQEDGLTELVTEYLLAYPTGYSVLDCTDEGILYTPRRIDVDRWALASGSTDPILLGFAQWQQDELRKHAKSNIDYMSGRNPIKTKEKTQAAEFFYEVMNAYWQGALFRERSALKALPGYEPFFRCADGYAYDWWLKDLIENASPLLEGFTIPWADVNAAV